MKTNLKNACLRQKMVWKINIIVIIQLDKFEKQHKDGLGDWNENSEGVSGVAGKVLSLTRLVFDL